MNFHELMSLLGELESVQGEAAALAERLTAASKRLADTGLSLDEAVLDRAATGADALAGSAAALRAEAVGAEIGLRATLHAPSLAVWELLRPIAEAFAAHPDWECELAVPAEFVAAVEAAPCPVVSAEGWFADGWVSDLSVTVLRYPDQVEARLRELSWTVALLPAYELPDGVPLDDYWRVLDTARLPYPPPLSSARFHRALRELPAGKVPVLWCPESYDDLFGDGLGSVRLLEQVRRRDDLVLLWSQDVEAVQALPERKRGYLADIQEAARLEGLVVEVGLRDFFHAVEAAHGVCTTSPELVEIFDRLGRPSLTAVGDEAVRQFAAASAPAPAPTSVAPDHAGRLVNELTTAFIAEFLGTPS